MDADLAWTAAGALIGAVALLIGVSQIVISLLNRRDERGGRTDTADDAVLVAGAGLSPPWGRVVRPGLRGRDEVMRKLGRSLRHRPGRVQVVAGMGGVGKSAVALALCSRARRRRWWRRRRAVWWVSAADQASLIAGMISLARNVGASEHDRRAIAESASDAPERLWALLERSRRGWLLVVDNADQPDLLAAPAPASSKTLPTTVADGTGWIRPTRRGLVVVTSRVGDRRVWGAGQVDVHQLRVLPPEAATTMLLDLVGDRSEGRRTRRRASAVAVGEQDAARDLAVQLGGLPLALHLAGGAIGSDFSSWASFTDYRMAMDTAGAVLLEPDPDTPQAADPRVAVTRTWELSLDALAAHRIPQARPLLRLLSCYAPAVPIPTSLLADPAIADLLAGRGRRWSRPDLVHTQHALARVGLIDVVDMPDAAREPQGIVVHPLVADTNRSHLAAAGTDQTATAVRHAAVALLAHATTALDFVSTAGTADWPRWRLFAPHVQAVLTSVAADLSADDLAMLLDIVARMVHFHVVSGAEQTGHELGRAALAHSHRVSADHPALVHLRFRFARSVMRLGHREQAEPQFRQVLEDMIRVLGPNHPETLLARLHVAFIPARQGHWEQAQSEQRRLLDDMNRALGTDHLYTFIARCDYAYVAGEQGCWEQVETECRQLLDDMARVPSQDQLLILFVRLLLARALGQLGRGPQAEADLRQVLDHMTRLLGPDHPETLTARRELARVVRDLGRRHQAETDLRQVLDDMTRVLGPDHPETVKTQRELIQAAGRVSGTDAPRKTGK